jgi:hypothetical protein
MSMKKMKIFNQQTPPRVPPRLEGVVKNIGIKNKKKAKRPVVVI